MVQCLHSILSWNVDYDDVKHGILINKLIINTEDYAVLLKTMPFLKFQPKKLRKGPDMKPADPLNSIGSPEMPSSGLN